MADASDANREVFDRVAGSYADLALKPAEQAVLALLADRLHQLSMLDIGVGSGRTGYTFAPIVRSYIGIDYAPRMIERARLLLGEEKNTRLVVGDARELPFADDSFDFVLFSFNGIDSVGHEDRLQILSEVNRVLARDGHFLFSTHVLGALPLATSKYQPQRTPRSRGHRTLARLRDVAYGPRIRKLNRSLDLSVARERGWIVVPKIGHNFRVDDHYIDPALQVEQLEHENLDVLAIYDPKGHEVEVPYEGRGPWLDFFCCVKQGARRARTAASIGAAELLSLVATAAASILVLPQGLG